jgi:hypothetical protein
LAKSPYCIEGVPWLPGGATLIIEPGVFVKFKPNAGLDISGTVRALGTAENRIYFTAYGDEAGGEFDQNERAFAGYWRGLIFVTGSNFESDYNIIRYGGQGPMDMPVRSRKKIKPTIRLASWYTYPGPALKFVNGSGNISNLDYYNNGDGLRFEGNSQVVIENSRLTGNFFNAGPTMVQAVNNWWGHPIGPNYCFEESGYCTATVGGNVNIEPWLADNPIW